jgi:hypothetical protein
MTQKNNTMTINEKQHKVNDLIGKFNKVMLDMIDHITQYYPDSDISIAKSLIEKIVTEHPDKGMSMFLLNVYGNDEYRKNILLQNDNFFINNEYEHLHDKSNADLTGWRMEKIFQFKELWKLIDNDTKNYIKKSVMIMIKICEKYLLTI